LYKEGTTVNLARDVEKYKMKCVTLQEVRWQDFGMTKVSQTTIFNGKCEQAHRLGTGFTIHESIIDTVKEFRDISPRLSTLTLTTENFDLVLINVHAPTEDKDEIEKELFYATLEDVFNTSVGQVRLILGDFNAKIVREPIYRNIIGIHSLHATSNDNGSKLIDFAVGKGGW